jgi:hypothetical protein
MRSPHTSPSLRTIAHMHNRASYFPSPPSSPGPTSSPVQVQHQYQHQQPHQHQHQQQHQHQHQHQSYPVTSSPLASPRMASPRADTVRPAASRRPTYTSAIPIGYNHVHPHHSPSLPTNNYAQTPPSPCQFDPRTQSLGDTRRRPSFKIDLPPRPAPSEILADQDQGSASYPGHTPYNAPRSIERPSVEMK